MSRLVLGYARTALIVLVLVGVATAYASRRIATDEAIDSANRIASVTAGAAVEPLLEDGILNSDPVVLAEIDRAVRGQLLQGPLVRVKIWRQDGTILYSDESRLIGQRFTLDDHDLHTLRTGEVEAGESDLSEPENRYEEQATRLLEVYVQVHTQGGTPLLFETYFRYEGVAETARQLWLRFAPLTLGALVLLAAYSWSTTTPSCARAWSGCSTPPPTSTWWARRPTAPKRSSWSTGSRPMSS